MSKRASPPGLGLFVKMGAASLAVMALFGWMQNGCFRNSTAGSGYEGNGGDGSGGGGGFCSVFGCTGNGGAGGAGGGMPAMDGGSDGAGGA